MQGKHCFLILFFFSFIFICLVLREGVSGLPIMNKDELSIVFFKREGTPPSSPSGYRPGKGGHTTATGLYMGEPERVKLNQSPSPNHEGHKQPIWIKAKSRKESPIFSKSRKWCSKGFYII